GEWIANKVMFCDQKEVDEIFAIAVCYWASPQELKAQPSSITELLDRKEEFVPEDLAAASVTMAAYTRRSKNQLPQAVQKISYHLESTIRTLFDLPAIGLQELLAAAVAKLDGAIHELQLAVRAFTRTNCVTAKRASVELVKKERQLKRIVLAA